MTRLAFSLVLSGLLSATLTVPGIAAEPAPIAAALIDPGRSEANRKLDAVRFPAQVLEFAGVRRGQVVVDYFAGNGYYTELLARLVGPKGVV